MPTYVYKFLDTGETLEVQQSFSDPTLTEAVHPATGVTMAVKKVFLPVGVTFKGDGFYKTDSRNGSKSGSSSSTSTSSTGESSSTSNGAGETSSSSTASGEAGGSSAASSTNASTGTAASTSS